jgi:glycosyltransferase 2 family protein
MTEPRISPESLSTKSSPPWLLFGLVSALVVVSLLALATDAGSLYRVANRVEPRRLLFPIACTIVSYTAMAASYQRIAATAGLDIGLWEMLKITLASTSANYVFSTGGLSGLAVRSYLFSQRYGLSSGNAVSISLAQTFLTNFVLLAFLFWGLLNLLLEGRLHGSSQAIVALLFFVSVLVSTAAVAVVASRAARERVLGFLMSIPTLFSRVLRDHGERLRARFELFEAEIHEGVDFLIARGAQMAVPLCYIALDWFLMLATLYTAFYCIAEPVPMHVVVIGFSTGVFLSIINLVPGGLGIMEGSMAAVFASFGVPLESAIVATVIFRVSYYVLPLTLTMIFFRQMVVLPRKLAGSAASSGMRSA